MLRESPSLLATPFNLQPQSRLRLRYVFSVGIHLDAVTTPGAHFFHSERSRGISYCFSLVFVGSIRMGANNKRCLDFARHDKRVSGQKSNWDGVRKLPAAAGAQVGATALPVQLKSATLLPLLKRMSPERRSANARPDKFGNRQRPRQ